MKVNNKIQLDDIRDCFREPCPFGGFGKKMTHLICFDENGSSAYVHHIRKALSSGATVSEDRRYFTLTGCLFSRNSFKNTAFLLRLVKTQTWGEDIGRTIIFHSRDIRRKLGPFNLSARKYGDFIQSLSFALDLVDCTVFSMTFDLLQYVKEGYQYDPYAVAFDHLLERIVEYLRKTEGVAYPRFALAFEARGQKENKDLLEHAKKLLYESGTKSFSKEELQKMVRGVFFNPKSTEEKGSNAYPGIEVADLFSYPLHRLLRSRIDGRDTEVVIKKLNNYPSPFKKGLILFPKSYADSIKTFILDYFKKKNS